MSDGDDNGDNDEIKPPAEFISFEDYLRMERDTLVTFKAPGDVYDGAKESHPHGEVTKRGNRMVYEMCYGDTKGEAERLDYEISQIEDENDELRSEIRERRAQIESNEQRLTRLRERRKNVDTSEQKLEAIMDTLANDVWDGRPVNVELRNVREAAQLAEVEPESIIERLKERTDAPAHAFEPPSKPGRTWSKSEADSIKREREKGAPLSDLNRFTDEDEDNDEDE